MKKIKFLFAAIIVAAFMSCSGGSTKTDTDAKDTTKNEAETEVVDDGKIDPFKDFPKDKIIAEVGDYVLTPMASLQEAATKNGPESQSFTFYAEKMSEPGEQYSKICFSENEIVEIPNYMIIPIKSGQTAKKGDILLAWSSGTKMMRAVVIDDSNPKEPIVNFLDNDWVHSSSEGTVAGPGQELQEIGLNSFNVLSNTWEPGTSLAVKEDHNYKIVTVIRVSGNKVLFKNWGSSMQVSNKADCFPIEIKPNVKVGDVVQVPWVASFINTKVTKVDTEHARVWCENPYGDSPYIIPFGQITTGLDIK